MDYDKTLLKLFFGNTDNFPFVFAKSDVDAEDMSIFVHPAPKDRNTMEVIFKCNYISVYILGWIVKFFIMSMEFDKNISD